MPEDCLGEVSGDLNNRRGQMQSMEAHGSAQVVNAVVPLANMFGYVSALRSMIQGCAAWTMAFDHYAPVPMPRDDDDLSTPAVAMPA